MPLVSIPESLNFPYFESVRDNRHRPFWSVMIPTYNHERFLERTLRSVLEQDPGSEEMQIEILDDCSTKSDSKQLVERIGNGRISFYRQPSRVGQSANWNSCIERARGHWVHILHQDDLLMPHFYGEYRRFIQQFSEVRMVFARSIDIDENDDWIQINSAPPGQHSTGIVEDALYKLVTGDFICAPSVVVARQAYETIGGFTSSFTYAIDWEMWMRLAEFGSIGYIHRPLFQYRVHSGSESSRVLEDATSIEESIRAVEIGARRLPQERRQNAQSLAYKHYAGAARSFCIRLNAEGKQQAATRLARWAFRLDPSLANLLLVITAFARAAKWKVIGWFKRASEIPG